MVVILRLRFDFGQCMPSSFNACRLRTLLKRMALIDRRTGPPTPIEAKILGRLQADPTNDQGHPKLTQTRGPLTPWRVNYGCQAALEIPSPPAIDGAAGRKKHLCDQDPSTTARQQQQNMCPQSVLMRASGSSNTQQGLAFFRPKMDTAFHGLVSKVVWCGNLYLEPSHLYLKSPFSLSFGWGAI